ncbi:MAG TPA: histidine--tRNA ligase [Chloroflexi bacterium]|nr:histidine--tRNA ligase [Chloroflexota bacterium]
MPQYQRPTGTLDILPEEQPYWYHVRSRARHLAELAGFERMDVPIFETTEVFARGVGAGTDIVDKEMYSFEDKGGSPITLRPEFTAGIVRAYIENGMHVRSQPVKLYTFGPIFRYERPQAGRYRQHTQFNVEILGEQDPIADLEVMLLAWDLYADLGFRDLAFQLNSTGCPQCKPQYVSLLKAYYDERYAQACDDCHRRLERSPLRVLDCKSKQCQPIIAAAPHIADHLCPECEAHFAALRQYLELLERRYTINHLLVRGLDYYTKTVFEVWAAGIGAQSAVCGGGRYDGLAELLGGPPTPGVGFGSGMERIILVMQELDVEAPPIPSPAVFLVHLGAPAKRKALELTYALRTEDVSAWISHGDRGLRSQLREAGKRAAHYAVILGENELASGVASVRDMEAGEQVDVQLSDLVTWLKEHVRGRLSVPNTSR